MFCGLSLAATAVVALAVGIQPASAIYVGNALSENGISSNPVTLNGVNAGSVDPASRSNSSASQVRRMAVSSPSNGLSRPRLSNGLVLSLR